MVRVILFFVLASALVTCSPKKDQLQQSLAQELDSYFKEQVPSNGPGVAVIVKKGDSVIFSGGYGLSDLNTKDSITTRTLFNLGSISKTFVANAILILQEQGKLSVEDSIYKYFPKFKNKGIAQRVKIKHLLSHTSGLPDNRQVSKDTAFYLTAKDLENWYPITQTDTLIFEPGTRFEYSNPAYNGLALIVEQVSGMKWQKFIESTILKPSGMTSTTITDGPHPESGVSHGYIKVNGQWRELDYGEEPTFPAAGNGGVWSSVEELVLYEKAIKKGVFLKPETILQSRTVFHPKNWSSPTPPMIGWSWFIENGEFGKSVGHTGIQGGFLCNYVTLPDQNIQLVILCNTPLDIEAFTKKVINSIIQ